VIYKINPVAKPRMTRSDRWKKRPAVVKYHAFKDECRLNNVQVPIAGASIIFNIQMPKSWSKNKKAMMSGQPHRQTPDLSNLLKALEDAIFLDDSCIWNYASLTKRWSYEGDIEII